MENLETQFWDVWTFFIRYGIWILWGISLISKILRLNLIKKHLGKDYNTFPDLSKVAAWRKIIASGLLVLSAASFFTALIKSASLYYFAPLLIMSGIVYFNGKISAGRLNVYSVLFHSENGFVVLPDKFKMFSVAFYTWDRVEKVTLGTETGSHSLNINLKNENHIIKIISHKNDMEKYSNVFRENGIDCNA